MTQIGAVEAGVEALSGIPFVEFTSKLIDGVVDALVDSQLQQVHAYQDFFKAVSTTLEQYINDTKDDVDQAQILQYLQNLPPLPAPATIPATTNTPAVTSSNIAELATSATGSNAAAILTAALPLTSQIVGFLNNRLQIPGLNSPNQVATPAPDAETNPTATATVTVGALYDAVAKKISHDRYGMLEQMVKMGLQRVVLDNAVIETRFIFHSYETHVDDVERTDKFRDKEVEKSKDAKKSGPIINMFRRHKEKNVTRSRQLTVKTLKEHHRDVSGASVDIYASVKVLLKGDYFPLNK